MPTVLLIIDTEDPTRADAEAIVRHTAPLGMRFVILNAGPTENPAHQAPIDIANSENRSLSLNAGWAQRPRDTQHAAEVARRIALDTNAAVVHTSHPGIAAAGLDIPVLLTPKPGAVQEQPPREATLPRQPARQNHQQPTKQQSASQPTHARRATEQTHAGLRAATLVVTPTAAMLNTLRRAFGGTWAGRVINHAIDPKPQHPAQPSPFHPHAQANNTRGKAPLVLAAGTVTEENNAFQALHRATANLGWTCLIAGNTGTGLPWHRRHTQEPGALLLGELKPQRLDELMHRAAVFAHPVHEDHAGIRPLQAAHAGAALVLSDIPTHKEIWSDAALYTPPGDEHELARKLRKLARSPRLLRRMQDKAHARALTYGTNRLAGEYADAYRTLAARNATPAATPPRHAGRPF